MIKPVYMSAAELYSNLIAANDSLNSEQKDLAKLITSKYSDVSYQKLSGKEIRLYLNELESLIKKF